MVNKSECLKTAITGAADRNRDCSKNINGKKVYDYKNSYRFKLIYLSLAIAGTFIS